MQHLPRPLKYPPIFPTINGLVAHYAFDDRSGSLLRDRSRKRNHATISGATWVAGKKTPALHFDGINDFVKMPEGGIFTGLSTTMAVLAKSDNHSALQFIIGCRYTNLGFYIIRLTSGNLEMRLSWNNQNPYYDVNPQIALTDGVYAFISFVWDKEAGKIYGYKDGNLVGTTTVTGAPSEVNFPAYMGFQNETSYPLAGDIASCYIIRRALNAYENKRLAESQLMLVRS